MWERACSRMRWFSHQMHQLTLHIREQARSHNWTDCTRHIIRNRRTTHVFKRVRPVQDWHRPLKLSHRWPDARRSPIRRRPQA
ncbi:hypothetical protein GDV60_21320 [Pseudomonas sp. DTU12.1]|nr:hypothetical protein GDV60_21320 [Pseudomonas sp. DTU12.1]